MLWPIPQNPWVFHRDSALASLGETPGNFSQDNLLTSLKKHLDTFKQKMIQLLAGKYFEKLQELVKQIKGERKNTQDQSERILQKLESQKQQLIQEIKKLTDKLLKKPQDKLALLEKINKETEFSEVDKKIKKIKGSDYNSLNDLIQAISGG